MANKSGESLNFLPVHWNKGSVPIPDLQYCACAHDSEQDCAMGQKNTKAQGP